MDPDDLKVPGRDKVGKSNGPAELVKAHDGRLDLGDRGLWKPGFVESIVADNVHETVVVWKDGDGTPWVVDGVQRVLAAREAKKLRKAKGDDRPVTVPVLSPATKLDDVQRFALSLRLNNLRHDDPPLVRAAKAAELFRMARGAIVGGRERTEAEAVTIVCEAIGEKAHVVRDLLKLDAAPAAQKAEVQAGTATPTAVVRLQSLPTDVQDSTLKQLKATGPVTADRVREAVTVHKATKGGTVLREDAKVRPSISTVRKIFEHEDFKNLDAQAQATIRWILGEVGPRAVTGLSPIVRDVEGNGSDKAAE